jgi:predicted Zn-dependent protease
LIEGLAVSGLHRNPAGVPRPHRARGLRHSIVMKRTLPILRLALVMLALGPLAACISDEREDQIGSTMASEVNPHLPIITDQALNDYVQTIGERIGRVSERPDLEYSFYIVDTDIVNAFALPGGHIYLTRGLISRMDSASELAGALGHEIGHVAARHGVRKLEREMRTGSVVSVLYNTILGGEPELLRENSLRLADVIWSADHSRRDEEEADRLAVRYLAKAGVDPTGVVTLLEKLLGEEEADSSSFSRLETWFSSHPLTRDRIEGAREAIGRLAADRAAPIPIDGFEQFRERVVQAPPSDSGSTEGFPPLQ